jgi:hypothetical protein
VTAPEEHPTIREQIDDNAVTATAAAQTLGHALGTKASNAFVWKVAFVVSCFAVAASVGISSIALSQLADQRAAQVASDRTAQTIRQRADDAYAAAQAANDELKRRGQQPVTVPKPTDTQSSDTIVAAATARVLASLPPVVSTPPTAASIAAAVAGYFAANPPPSVTPTQVANAVAAYLAANPPPSGAQGPPGVDGAAGPAGPAGPKGDAGPPPTAQQIMDAFNDAATSNPSLLCAGKGTFRQLDGVRIDDPANPVPGSHKSITIWTCIPNAEGTTR